MSASANLKKTADDKMLISGDLNFETVPELCRQAKEIFTNNMTVDLTGVEYSDSAGLALLIDWLRHAKAKRHVITFINPPEQMQAIAKVCGLQTILGF